MRRTPLMMAILVQFSMIPAWAADEPAAATIPAVEPVPLVPPIEPVAAVPPIEPTATIPVAEPPVPPITAPAEVGDEGGLLRRRREEGEAPPAVEVAAPEPETRTMDPLAQPGQFDRAQFRPDPSYPEPYDPKSQYVVYGGKTALSTPRPLLELGYPLYSGGDFGPGHNIIGEKNLVRPQLLVYGDFRTVYGRNDNGAVERNEIANRLNLDIDLKLTGTERIHALMRPLDHDGKFTRYDFKDHEDHWHDDWNADPVTLFFEGDLGQLTQGFTDSYNKVDLPIAAGLVPLLFQNGVWLDDAFDGLAVSIPAKNSPVLGISNFDVTFFAGWDEVSTGAIKAAGKQDQHAADMYGVATFFERKEWYYEFDYGYTKDNESDSPFDRSYHNLSAAATTRFGNWLSHSTRVIANFGQDHNPGGERTADGAVILLENSFMTKLPYTLLPYLNLFYGDKSPQSMARDPGAGGVLKNTGINFETDNLTGFPKLDDTAQNSYGGALGLEYLFNLDRQVVVEVAALDRHGRDSDRGSQYAFGVRFQQPFWRQWIFRVDGIVGDQSKGEDFWGGRVELRCKF